MNVSKIKKTSFTALLLLYFFVTAASANAVTDALQEQKVLLKIHSTRTLTAHLSIGYTGSSVRKIAKSINSSDVPVLIRLHNQNRDRTGVKIAIVTQCGAGLDGLVGLDSTSDIMDIAGDIARSADCDSGVRDRAKKWHDKLFSELEERIQQRRSDAIKDRD